MNREIVWRVYLRSEPADVFALLATDEGRASFWAEKTEQAEDRIVFHFPNGEVLESSVVEVSPPYRFALTYFDRSIVSFELRSSGGGTDLLLRESSVADEQLSENRAGWVSVLMNLKARADFGVDLRNHDPSRTWSDGYVDN